MIPDDATVTGANTKSATSWKNFRLFKFSDTLEAEPEFKMVEHRLLAENEHIGLVVRMSIMDTEVDGSNPSVSMFSP